MWYAQGPGPWGHVKDFKLSRQPVSFWGMQYEYEIKEWIHDLVSAMSPFRNVNPIFSIKMWSRLVKNLDSTSQSKSHFGWETTHCGPNGAKVWLFQGPFGEISCSWNLLFPRARSLWSTVACRWIPSSPFKTSMLWTGPAEPWPSYQRLWYWIL